MGPSTRLWILALLLVACRGDSSSSSLAVRSISVPDFGSWESNRPIEFAFDQPVDFASVSARSISIRTSADVPAAGTFQARAVDADGDGVPDGTDESVVVFYPLCARAADLTDAGLTPGVRYLVKLAGADSGAEPGALLRARSGDVLARTVVQAFETIADPLLTLHDERPGAPPRPRLRAAGASAGPGCHLELGEDPSKRVFFEGGPVSGRPPEGFAAPLNLLGDRATHVAFVVVLDQPVRDTPENLAHLWLEYATSLDAPAWIPLETRSELLSNCRPDDVAVRLVPLGAFPSGGFVRAAIEAGFEDLVGEATAVPLDDFALAEVTAVTFTSLVPAGAVADEIREEFDFGAGSPLSFADPAPLDDAAPAFWGQGELRANQELIRIPPELSAFDWIVRTGQAFVFDTTATRIQGGPNGIHLQEQETSGGFVAVRNLHIQIGGTLRIRGPNPMVIHAKGTVRIDGTIEASGFDAPTLLAFGTGAGAGGPGCAGGGAGGSSRLGPDSRGTGGSAAFESSAGGAGGESAFSPGEERRGGGGGGGRFAANQGSLIAEPGGDGATGGTGLESGLSPARGGSPGPELFTDGDPSNDFFGVQPLVDASGAVVGKRSGELDRIHAGTGGGSGGDSIEADSLPPPVEPAPDQEGAGGGGGGGALVIRALGRITFGQFAQIRANGGSGGRRRGAADIIGGACGGSGSGGHVILESAEAIDFTGGNPNNPPKIWIQAVGGPRVVQAPSDRGAGGAGGPGVVQLHVPNPERRPGDPGANVILPSAALGDPDPLSAVCQPRPHILYPTVESLSRARSRWIPLGAAGEGGVREPSVVALLFDGIETAPGDDEGKVRTSGGRLLELAPILGPANLAEPGIELLPDGTSLVLSGPVLAPLRASAQPISPDVYLRTPALLAGQTLRLANALDPGRRSDLTIAGARYDDATSRLTLVVAGLVGTLAAAIAELGEEVTVELTLVPSFFRVRLGPSGVDLLPDSHSVRILFQGAADDGTGHADEANPLVDWTGDVTEFGALAPGALDFVRFQVEFGLDPGDAGFDPEAEPIALEYLRFPLRF